MAGFAVLFQTNGSVQLNDRTFAEFLQLVGVNKCLNVPGTQVFGTCCAAAKLDAPSSLHPGIVSDTETGSWLMAAGTVVSLTSDNLEETSLNGLLSDYLNNGVGALQRYDGHFALIIYDGREDSLSIISDPMGIFSIYYGSRNNQTFISTSAFAVAQQINSHPDNLIIECILRTGRPHGDKTLWQDVRKVRPATILKLTGNLVEETEYWSPTIDPAVAKMSMDDAVDKAIDICSRMFKRILLREGHLWADLTGGLDTRLNISIMDRLGLPFTAYCVGPDDHPDVVVSQIISAQKGWEYRHMPLPNDWDVEQIPWIDTALRRGDAHLNVLQLAGVLQGQTERSQFFKVNVVGIGADEWREHIYGVKVINPRSKVESQYDDILDSRIFSPIPVMTLRRDRTTEVRDELKKHFARIVSRSPDFPILPQTDILFLRHRHPTHTGAYLSAMSGIMRPIMPFCFKELENFGFSLKDNWRITYHYGFVRNMLERCDPQLASIRTAKGEPALPIRISNLQKFSPLWKSLINLATEKTTKKLTGKPLAIWPHHPYPEYPLPAWRIAWVKHAVSQGLLEPDKMRSGVLYKAEELRNIVTGVLRDGSTNGEFLDRVITIEMALRAVGTNID